MSIASCVAICTVFLSNTYLYVSLGRIADVLTCHSHTGHDDVQLTLGINFKEREKQPPESTELYARTLIDCAF